MEQDTGLGLTWTQCAICLSVTHSLRSPRSDGFCRVPVTLSVNLIEGIPFCVVQFCFVLFCERRTVAVSHSVNRFTSSFSTDLSRLWFHERFQPAQPCNLVVVGAITAARCRLLSLSTLVSSRRSFRAKLERFGVMLSSGPVR